MEHRERGKGKKDKQSGRLNGRGRFAMIAQTTMFCNFVFTANPRYTAYQEQHIPLCVLAYPNEQSQ
jgi:putative salt-induced outer membrane protein YdiY